MIKEIYNRTFYGAGAIVISIAQIDDGSFSISIAKYRNKTKSHFLSHQQFSLNKDHFKEFVESLNQSISEGNK